MDLDDNIITLAMSLPYGSRIKDPNLLGEILDEVDYLNLTLDGVDPVVDDIADAIDLTDEETIWFRRRVREEISRECD